MYQSNSFNSDNAYLPSECNASTNSETNGAWPDLLCVAAMNRHCVTLPRGRKKAELCFSPCARKKEGRARGEERKMTLAERDCRDVGEGVRRENIRRDLRDRRRVVLDETRTLGDAPVQKRQSGLGRAGSRCYLRDAARLCTQRGHGATQRTRYTTHGTRMYVHTVYIHTVN